MISVLGTIGHSLLDGLGMFWATLWALVLGFGLSGAVQAFISRARMQQTLGDERPATIAKAGFFGAISSSCSYAASALAKTLFARGANFTAAQAFMFASTNLVLELGIVLWLLIGWQFAVAEFIGGALMITLLALALPRVLNPAALERARERLNQSQTPSSHDHRQHDHHSGTDSDSHSGSHSDDANEAGSPARIRTKAGWADAAGYTVSDLTMLRKELFIGFLVAGFLDVAVPVSLWQSLFITGHGFWSSLENVILGPFLAIISFVCSVGNVPLAAALWTGGISFGGVVAFVFADLIAMPLLLIYRKYYGTAITARLLAVFWATMSLSGLAVEYLFKFLGIVPNPATGEHGSIGRDTFGWNYTTVLNILALAAFGILYWLYRNRDRYGAGVGYAKDPVCGMQIQTAHAPATADHNGQTYYFCSDHCRERFQANPDRFTGESVPDTHQEPASDTTGGGQAVDPVCGMTVDPEHAAATAHHSGQTYYFCSDHCRARFQGNPDRFTEESVPASDTTAGGQAVDPVCGMTVDPEHAAATAHHNGQTYYFCSRGCRDTFQARSDQYVAST